MPELFGFDDLSKVLADVTAFKGREAADIIEAWGIDYEELQAFLAEGIQQGANEMRDKDPETFLQTMMNVGFFLGFKTCLEIETRKLSS